MSVPAVHDHREQSTAGHSCRQTRPSVPAIFCLQYAGYRADCFRKLSRKILVLKGSFSWYQCKLKKKNCLTRIDLPCSGMVRHCFKELRHSRLQPWENGCLKLLCLWASGPEFLLAPVQRGTCWRQWASVFWCEGSPAHKLQVFLIQPKCTIAPITAYQRIGGHKCKKRATPICFIVEIVLIAIYFFPENKGRW